MKLRYSPVKYNAHSPACAGHLSDTVITVMDDNALNIDGEVYEFDPLDVAWPTISADTDGVILEAHREGGELYVTVRRFYTSDWQSWYSEDYK
jgi:hypothetical protein